MLVLIAVVRQVGAVFVPLEVRPHLILDICKIGIDGQVVSARLILDGFGAARLRADGFHHSPLVYHPHYGRLPI